MNLEVAISVKQGGFQLKAEFQCAETALGIFGPSGSGKTTLFRAVSGLVRPTRGRIVLDGETLFDSERRICVPAHKRKIGLVFQDARLFPHWNAEQNLRAGDQNGRRIENRPFGFDEVVELLDIGRLIGRETADLSGGEKQRIALGRTLLSNPRLLLLDEPVAGLDVSLKMQILPFLSRIHTQLNIPIILISHDLGEILQLTDQLLLLRDGGISGYGKLTPLLQHPETLQELRGADLTNLISATVDEHNEERGTTRLRIAGGAFLSMELETGLSLGKSVCIGIAANQIALAKNRITDISMQNQLPGRVREIVHAPDRSICHVETEAGILFSEITPGTEKDMELKPGSTVWTLFKSMALRRL